MLVSTRGDALSSVKRSIAVNLLAARVKPAIHLVMDDEGTGRVDSQYDPTCQPARKLSANRCIPSCDSDGIFKTVHSFGSPKLMARSGMGCDHEKLRESSPFLDSVSTQYLQN